MRQRVWGGGLFVKLALGESMRLSRVLVFCLLLTIGGVGGVVAVQSAGAMTTTSPLAKIASLGPARSSQETKSSVRIQALRLRTSRTRAAHWGKPRQTHQGRRAHRSRMRVQRSGGGMRVGTVLVATKQQWERRQAWLASAAARAARVRSRTAYTNERARDEPAKQI